MIISHLWTDWLSFPPPPGLRFLPEVPPNEGQLQIFDVPSGFVRRFVPHRVHLMWRTVPNAATEKVCFENCVCVCVCVCVFTRSLGGCLTPAQEGHWATFAMGIDTFLRITWQRQRRTYCEKVQYFWFWSVQSVVSDQVANLLLFFFSLFFRVGGRGRWLYI